MSTPTYKTPAKVGWVPLELAPTLSLGRSSVRQFGKLRSVSSMSTR